MLIDKLHEVGFSYKGIVFNAGAYTHTSVALSDAIKAIETPVVEVHISNVFAREAFRHKSMIAPFCQGSISGFGLESYRLALQYFERTEAKTNRLRCKESILLNVLRPVSPISVFYIWLLIYNFIPIILMLNFYPGPSKVYPEVRHYMADAYDEGFLEHAAPGRSVCAAVARPGGAHEAQSSTSRRTIIFSLLPRLPSAGKF